MAGKEPTVALGPISALGAHGGPHGHHPTTVWGFAAAASHLPIGGADHGAAGELARGRSLLSELLKDVAVCLPSDATLSEEYESDDMDENFLEDMEAAFGTSLDWHSLGSAVRSSADQSDKSSQCSQPINIPVSTYYKDEMQKAALEKLNQKRKWYQQQLENERLAGKNLATKGRPLQGCAPTAKYHKHNSRLVS